MKTDNQHNKITDNVNLLPTPSSDSGALADQPAHNQKIIESLRKLQRADAFYHKRRFGILTRGVCL